MVQRDCGDRLDCRNSLDHTIDREAASLGVSSSKLGGVVLANTATEIFGYEFFLMVAGLAVCIYPPRRGGKAS